jgi:hypothetical protein
MKHILAKYGDLSRYFLYVVLTGEQTSSQFWDDFYPVVNYKKYFSIKF